MLSQTWLGARSIRFADPRQNFGSAIVSRTTVLTAAVFLLALALVLVLINRPTTTGLPRVASVTHPAVPDRPDHNALVLAKYSTEPVITGFIASFRDSSIAACRNSLVATLKNKETTVADNGSAICGCASDRVVESLTVGEVHAATVSAVDGDAASNPTILALQIRFSDATKQCMADNQAR